MTPVREAYLRAAQSAIDLLGDPAVASAWSSESALSRLSVGGLAAHLAAQVVFVGHILDEPVPPGEPVSLLDHYERVRWLGADLYAEANVQIRASGEAGATDGPAAVAGRARQTLQQVRDRLPAEAADRVVRPPGGPWGLRLDDFLVTRLMEIVVHSDDLAFSLDRATPDFPPSVLDPVLSLLSTLAVRRHGAPAVIRALSRAERAPRTISAF